MNTFIAMAWRNLWRNSSRSLITIGGIGVGIFGLLIYYGISNGFIDEMVQMAIRLELGHVQVTREGYHRNPVQGKSFRAESTLLERIERVEGVSSAAGRLTAAVLVNSAGKSRRMDLSGVDPERERRVTDIAGMIERGDYLAAGDEEGIVIGAGLAEHLDVRLGDKIVVMTQDSQGELQSGLFRVKGVFRTNSPGWEKSAAFVTLDAMRELLGRPGEFTAVLVRAGRHTGLDPIVNRIRNELNDRPELAVQPWKEVSPLLGQSVDMFNNFVWIFYLIIYLAMAFGVVNIMLMAVLDRTRELGVMRAVGTTPGQVMLMVLLEGAFLGLAGIAVGGGAAWLVNGYLATHGLDLGRWSGAMEYMGIGSVIHPDIAPAEWIVSFASAEAAVIVSSLWPAWRSARVEPVKALQFE